MRTLLQFLFAVLLVGCSPNPAQNPVDHLNPVPMEVVAQVPKRLKQVRIGSVISEAEVFQILGLSSYQVGGGEAGGQENAFWVMYQLRIGFNLVLTFDHRVKPPVLVAAGLGGDGWRTLKQ